jgi:hypothetical protein
LSFLCELNEINQGLLDVGDQRGYLRGFVTHKRPMLTRGRVIKAGRTLTLAQAEVFAENAGQEKLVAFLVATLMTITGGTMSTIEH